MSESIQSAADQLIAYAAGVGRDLAILRNTSDAFEAAKRTIEFWIAGDLFGYQLSGRIIDLPGKFAEPNSCFRGTWTETGDVATLEQAFALLDAWLIELREVDELPSRTVLRCGIS